MVFHLKPAGRHVNALRHTVAISIPFRIYSSRSLHVVARQEKQVTEQRHQSREMLIAFKKRQKQLQPQIRNLRHSDDVGGSENQQPKHS